MYKTYVRGEFYDADSRPAIRNIEAVDDGYDEPPRVFEGVVTDATGGVDEEHEVHSTQVALRHIHHALQEVVGIANTIVIVRGLSGSV